jgi:hypothetical protein
MKYRLRQEYFAIRPFETEGTLEELAHIITASNGEIIHLDDSHYGPGKCWDEAATGYDGPGWYYKIRNIDDGFAKAASLEDAVRQVGSHDTSRFELIPHEFELGQIELNGRYPQS